MNFPMITFHDKEIMFVIHIILYQKHICDCVMQYFFVRNTYECIYNFAKHSPIYHMSIKKKREKIQNRDVHAK